MGQLPSFFKYTAGLTPLNIKLNLDSKREAAVLKHCPSHLHPACLQDSLVWKKTTRRKLNLLVRYVRCKTILKKITIFLHSILTYPFRSTSIKDSL